MAGKELTIRRGETFKWSLRPEQPLLAYALVTAVSKTAPIRLTVPAHGLPDGWRFAVTGAKGPTALNAKNSPMRTSDYFNAKVIDEDTIEINKVNGTAFPSYTGGGVIQYGVPMDLVGVTVRAHVRTTENSPAVLLDLGLYATLDPVLHRINFVVPEAITAAITAASGVYDVEIVDASGNVMALPKAGVTFTGEVTRG